MEGGGPDGPAVIAHQVLQAPAHLLRRLVGEGDGQQVGGGHPHFPHEIGQAVGEHPGLTAAGAGQDEERPFGMKDRLPLLRVEVLQDIYCRQNNSFVSIHASTILNHGNDKGIAAGKSRKTATSETGNTNVLDRGGNTPRTMQERDAPLGDEFPALDCELQGRS